MLITEFSRNFAAHFSRWSEQLWQALSCLLWPISIPKFDSLPIEIYFIRIYWCVTSVCACGVNFEIVYPSIWSMKLHVMRWHWTDDELFVDLHIVISALLGQASIFDVLRQKKRASACFRHSKNEHYHEGSRLCGMCVALWKCSHQWNIHNLMLFWDCLSFSPCCAHLDCLSTTANNAYDGIRTRESKEFT